MLAPIIVFLLFSGIVIIITGCWEWISSVIFPNQTWGLYSKSFFEGVLSNAHGTIIDLFVIGLVLFWFEQRRSAREDAQREKRQTEKEKERLSIIRENDIKRYRETLSDLRFYRAPDAPYRALGAIRRLVSLGETGLEISEIDLSNFDIKNLTISKSDLHATIFKNSHISNLHLKDCRCEAAIFIEAELKHTKFINSSLHRAKFNRAILKGMNFTTCDITWANFDNSNLSSANFKNVDCKGASFAGAELRSANFIGAKNLPKEVLEAAKLPNGPIV